MAKTDRIQVRIEPEVKEQAAELFDSLGISLSDAITMFVYQSLITGGIPFSVERESSRRYLPVKQSKTI